MAAYTILVHPMKITVTGEKGEFTHDYTQHSTRTKIYRQFISKVLAAYGTKAINDILYHEGRI